MNPRLPRIAFTRPVHVVALEPGGRPRRLLSANVSRGGMFIRGENPPPPGTVVRVALEARGKVLPFMRAKVVWHAPRHDAEGRPLPGFGVHFMDALHPRSSELLSFLVDRRPALPEPGAPVTELPPEPVEPIVTSTHPSEQLVLDAYEHLPIVEDPIPPPLPAHALNTADAMPLRAALTTAELLGQSAPPASLSDSLAWLTGEASGDADAPEPATRAPRFELLPEIPDLAEPAFVGMGRPALEPLERAFFTRSERPATETERPADRRHLVATALLGVLLLVASLGLLWVRSGEALEPGEGVSVITPESLELEPTPATPKSPAAGMGVTDPEYVAALAEKIEPPVRMPEPVEFSEVQLTPVAAKADAPAAPPAADAAPTGSGTSVVELSSGAARSIRVQETSEGLALELELAPGAQIENAFVLGSPNRVVVDVSGVLPEGSRQVPLEGGAISAVRVGARAAGTRLVLDLSRKAALLDRSGSALSLAFR